MQRRTVKEIAKDLDLSPDAVEGRLRTARRVLGVETSAEAARLLALSEHGYLYSPSVYGPSGVAPEPVIERAEAIDHAGSGSPDRGPERTADDSLALVLPSARGFGWPFPTRERPRNDLSLAWRLLMPLLLFALLALGSGLLLSGLAAVSNLVRSLRAH